MFKIFYIFQDYFLIFLKNTLAKKEHFTHKKSIQIRIFFTIQKMSTNLINCGTGLIIFGHL